MLHSVQQGYACIMWPCASPCPSAQLDRETAQLQDSLGAAADDHSRRGEELRELERQIRALEADHALAATQAQELQARPGSWAGNVLGSSS